MIKVDTFRWYNQSMTCSLATGFAMPGCNLLIDMIFFYTIYILFEIIKAIHLKRCGQRSFLGMSL
jgi:hypothetical protein